MELTQKWEKNRLAVNAAVPLFNVVFLAIVIGKFAIIVLRLYAKHAMLTKPRTWQTPYSSQYRMPRNENPNEGKERIFLIFSLLFISLEILFSHFCSPGNSYNFHTFTKFLLLLNNRVSQ